LSLSNQHTLSLPAGLSQRYCVSPVLPDPPKPSRPILPKTTAGLDPFTAGKIFLHCRFHGRFHGHISSFSIAKNTYQISLHPLICTSTTNLILGVCLRQDYCTRAMLKGHNIYNYKVHKSLPHPLLPAFRINPQNKRYRVIVIKVNA